MNQGRIKGMAAAFICNAPAFKVLVEDVDGSWGYVFLPASNYRIRYGDWLSWNEGSITWHAGARDVHLYINQPVIGQ
jgi:hypothetical protein